MPIRTIAAFVRTTFRSVRPAARAFAVFALSLSVTGTTDGTANAQSFVIETEATHAIIVDAATGLPLLEKNADEPIPPASMSKLMTAVLVFEALEQGRLRLDETVPVTREAFRREGSTMYLNMGQEPTVADLLRGMIVQSGNDASVLLAQTLAGSEEAFAERMNAKAAEIGLENSVFRNATGLPDPEHRMTVRDLATLARHLIDVYPEHYALYSERSFTWAGVEQPNRNPLLSVDDGADGLKTGFTREAGYGMVGSTVRDGRRVVAVITGLRTRAARRTQMQRLLAWAYREFESVPIAGAGEIFTSARVWAGAKRRVALASDRPVAVTMPRIRPEGSGPVRAAVVYRGPPPAPIEAGARVATLRIETPGLGVAEWPLFAAEPVEKGGLVVRLVAGAELAADWTIASLAGAEETPPARAAAAVAPADTNEP